MEKNVTFKEQFAKLVDLKSILTLLLVATLVFLVVYSTINGNGTLDEKLFLLFSNIITMTVTYFFTKKKEEEKKIAKEGVNKE